MEIMSLWNSFKIDFPEGQINRGQMEDLVTQIFPRCDADVVINNIFKIFDPDDTGRVVPNELLMAFSMSMKGTVEEKLHWTFKLYDKDGSGEIDPEEMEDIFCKLCKIAEGVEVDQQKKKMREQELEQKRRREREKDEEKKKQEGPVFAEDKEVRLMSQKKKHLENSVGITGLKASMKFKSRARMMRRMGSLDRARLKEEAIAEVDEAKVQVIQEVMDELSDRQKEIRSQNVKQRARQLFDALDEDGNGLLTEEEFVNGCLSDKIFIKVLEEFSGEFIWGHVGLGNE